MISCFSRAASLPVVLLSFYISVFSPALAEATQAPLNRDEIEYENRVRFFRQAVLLAKQEQLKREAVALEANHNWVRAQKLFGKNVMTENEYRERKLQNESASLAVTEQTYIIAQLELDAKVAELYRRISAGETEDLAIVADFHVSRWNNVEELARIALKKAELALELAEWEHKAQTRMHKSGASTLQELERVQMNLTVAKGEVETATARIEDAKKSLADAVKTLERAKAESPAAQSPTATP